MDHVMPLSKWWINSIFNIQWLCASCNMKKHAKLPTGQLSIFNTF
jgi:5-methylcytosine-specific restriction endonuclease McrA